MKKVKIETIDKLLREKCENIGFDIVDGKTKKIFGAISEYLDDYESIYVGDDKYILKKNGNIGFIKFISWNNQDFSILPLPEKDEYCGIGSLTGKVQYITRLLYILATILIDEFGDCIFTKIDDDEITILGYKSTPKDDSRIYTYAAVAEEDGDMLMITLPDFNQSTCAYDMKEARYMAHDLALILLWDLSDNNKEFPKTRVYSKDDFPGKTLFYITVSSEEIEDCKNGLNDTSEDLDHYIGLAKLVIDPCSTIFDQFDLEKEFDIHVKVDNIIKSKKGPAEVFVKPCLKTK